MSSSIEKPKTPKEPGSDTIGAWLNDPMGSVIAATASVITSFALVLTGIGMINMAV
ncbi:MAG: hypothetical protein AB8B48_21625 [Pseudomonadales bacterium]